MIMTSACAALHRKSEQGSFDVTTHRDIKTKAAHLTHCHVETEIGRQTAKTPGCFMVVPAQITTVAVTCQLMHL